MNQATTGSAAMGATLPMTALSGSSLDQAQHICRRTDVAERSVDGVEGGVVVLVAACSVRVSNKDDAIAQRAGIPCR